MTTDLASDTAACWGAFLLKGMTEEAASLPQGVSLMDYWEGGYLEMVTSATRHLKALWDVASSLPEWWNEHPGVFEYEVVCPLGAYLAGHLIAHHCLPKEEDVKAAIKHLVLTFFSEG